MAVITGSECGAISPFLAGQCPRHALAAGGHDRRPVPRG